MIRYGVGWLVGCPTDNVPHSDWPACRTDAFRKREGCHHRGVFNASQTAHWWVSAGYPVSVTAACAQNRRSPKSRKLPGGTFRRDMTETTAKTKKCQQRRGVFGEMGVIFQFHERWREAAVAEKWMYGWIKYPTLSHTKDPVRHPTLATHWMYWRVPNPLKPLTINNSEVILSSHLKLVF